MSSTLSLPPGPKGHFLFGNAREYLRDMLGFLENCAREYGDVVSLRFGRKRIYLLNHPDLVEEVLLTQVRNFQKGHSRELMGTGLLASTGEVWVRQRRMCQPAFHRDRFGGYSERMVNHIRHQLAMWKAGETRDIHEEMKHLAMGCIAKLLFDSELGEEYHAIEYSLDTLFQILLARRVRKVFALPLCIPTPQNRRFRRLIHWLHTFIQRHLDEAKRMGQTQSILAQLSQARDEEGRGMTDSQLRDQMVTLLFAGYETTAISLVWTWYLLSHHPHVEQRVADEVRQVLGDRPPRLADLAHLSYTEKVLQEVLRLYPPAYFLRRQALAECTLGGYVVPAGQILWFSQWVIQRDPRFFARPTEFDPERWSEDTMSRLPRFAYFPFGGGPRMCIGYALAQTEMLLAVALIAQQFRFSPMAAPTIRPVPTVTIRPGPGTKVTLTPR